MVSVRRNTRRDKFHGFITSVLTGMVSIYGTSIISVYTNIDTSYDQYDGYLYFSEKFLVPILGWADQEVTS